MIRAKRGKKKEERKEKKRIQETGRYKPTLSGLTKLSASPTCFLSETSLRFTRDRITDEFMAGRPVKPARHW